MKISIAHSPDSDDAFMFYGLARGGVDTGDLEVSHVLTDIETLNRHAQEGRHEVTAISFHAYPYVADRYALMPCGGSIGDGYGPLLVAREARDPARDRGDDGRGARARSPRRTWRCSSSRPGVATRVVPFDQILDEVREGRAEVGLVIHEGQLTYGGQGLREARGPRRVVEAGDGPAAAARRQRRAARPRARADGAAHAPRARDGEALARAPAAGARVRDELRARHGPGGRRPLRRDVGERHDASRWGSAAGAPCSSSSTAASRRASSRSA